MPSETQMVMGFEFQDDVAENLRTYDLALRTLADLQEHGVAIVSKSGYESCKALVNVQDEYWQVFENERGDRICLVCHEQKEVWEG